MTTQPEPVAPENYVFATVIGAQNGLILRREPGGEPVGGLANGEFVCVDPDSQERSGSNKLADLLRYKLASFFLFSSSNTSSGLELVPAITLRILSLLTQSRILYTKFKQKQMVIFMYFNETLY